MDFLFKLSLEKIDMLFNVIDLINPVSYSISDFSLGLNFNMQHRVVKHMYMLFYYFKSLIQ